MPAHKFELPATKVEFVQHEGNGAVLIVVHNVDQNPLVYQVSTELGISADGRTVTANALLQNVTPRQDDDIPF